MARLEIQKRYKQSDYELSSRLSNIIDFEYQPSLIVWRSNCQESRPSTQNLLVSDQIRG